MIYLSFETQLTADIAQSKISQNMGFTGSVTSAWALPIETMAGTWAFIKPDNVYMTGIVGYTEVENPEFLQIANL